MKFYLSISCLLINILYFQALSVNSLVIFKGVKKDVRSKLYSKKNIFESLNLPKKHDIFNKGLLSLGLIFIYFSI
jgi:hypothetical protein